MAEPELDRRALDEKRFRIDATINIAHIMTTTILIGTVLVWGFDLKAMVMKHDSEIVDMKQARRDSQVYLSGELQEINRKMDRIAERVGANK